MRKTAAFLLSVAFALHNAVVLAEAGSDEASLPYAEVTANGLPAHLYLPSGDGFFPTILAVGGPEGGFITGDAFGHFLPKAGFAVLGIACFDASGLPASIDRIPLEYFIKALDYAERNPQLDRDRIGLVGGSKGGELALL